MLVPPVLLKVIVKSSPSGSPNGDESFGSDNLNLIYKVPLVNDIELCGKVTNPLPPLSVPLPPGCPLVEYATLNVAAPALVPSHDIVVVPLPFDNFQYIIT